MNKENKDSTIVTYILDDICIIGSDCKIHNHKHVDTIHEKGMGAITHYNADYTNTNFDLKNDYFISSSGQLLFHERDTSVFSFSEVEKEVKKNMLKLASDTIAPTYYHSQGDTRSASEIIGTIKPKAMLYAENDKEYNDEVNAGAFTLMLLIVILYAYNSYSHWCSMIGKIKMAIKN